MSLERTLIVGIALAAATTFAYGQTPQPSLASLNVSCSDFTQKPNGSWTPVHFIKMTVQNGGNITMGPGASFNEGVSLLGVRLAALLDKECHGH